VLSMLAVGAVVWMVFGQSTETVTFRMVDEVSGILITNANAYVYKRWTALPVEKLGIDPWRQTVEVAVGGRITIAGIPRRSSVTGMKIDFEGGYGDHVGVGFRVGRRGWEIIRVRNRVTNVARTNDIVIPLQRIDRPLESPISVFAPVLDDEARKGQKR